MRLPEITALQFAVLSLLFDGEKTGQQLRHELKRWGGPRAAATFSRLMGRMQDAVYVDARRCPQVTHGQTVWQSRYRVTDLGLIVWHATRRFYNAFDPPPPGLEVVATDEAEFGDRDPKQRRVLVKRKYVRAVQKAFRQVQWTSRR
jgi:DNA-binding PadR family transcriptional regulator